MSNTKVAQNLKAVLSNSYALYLKTQNYHWNVTGPHFNSLHLLFNSQYTDLAAAIDEIAERIRTIGPKVEADFAYFEKSSKIKAGNCEASANSMVRELAEDNETLVKILKDCFKLATSEGDDATADLILGRVEVHQKNIWMLRSSL